MKFKIIPFLLLMVLFSIIMISCRTHTESLPEANSVGGKGLIVINQAKIPFQVTSETQVEVQPELDYSFRITSDVVLVDITTDLQIDQNIDFKISDHEQEFVYHAVVRKPCLTYIEGVVISPEIWQFCGQSFYALTQTSGGVIDYAVSQNGDWIIYAARNDEGGTNIWKMNRSGDDKELVYSCGDLVCEQVAINSQGSTIAFQLDSKEKSLFLFTIENEEKFLIENGKISNVDFSPNDEMLRYFEGDNGYIRVLSINNLRIIKTLVSDSDLLGAWEQDSSGFLYGQHDYWGGIAEVDLLEIDLTDGLESLIFDGSGSSIYFYQPIFIAENDFIVLARSGFNGNRKQIWEINGKGNMKDELTSDFRYNHSSISWNSIENKLSFQRFEPKSSTTSPQVWTWDFETSKYIMISDNAAHALWVY